MIDTKELQAKLVPGIVVETDARGFAEPLAACDDWDRAQFRYPNPVREWRWSRAIACNVEVTGRTMRYRRGSYWVRVRLHWPEDSDIPTAATHSGGWLLVTPDGDPIVQQVV